MMIDSADTLNQAKIRGRFNTSNGKICASGFVPYSVFASIPDIPKFQYREPVTAAMSGHICQASPHGLQTVTFLFVTEPHDLLSIIPLAK